MYIVSRTMGFVSCYYCRSFYPLAHLCFFLVTMNDVQANWELGGVSRVK
jgi:hypothetical protein